MTAKQSKMFSNYLKTQITYNKKQAEKWALLPKTSNQCRGAVEALECALQAFSYIKLV